MKSSMASFRNNDRLTVRAADWPEPLQPQDLVITLLGSYVRSSHQIVWSGGLVQLLGEFGFSMGSARVALTRLVRRDLVTRVNQGRRVYYATTPRSEQLLSEGDRRIFSLGREEHRTDTWTVLWHAIPEERRLERGRLGRRLRFLGFGSPQDGMWVSPHNREKEVTRLLQEFDVTQYAGVLLGRSARDLDLRSLVERAWGLDALIGRYQAFTHEFTPYRATNAQLALDDRAGFLLRTRLVHLFRGFPFLDPELPDEFMPDPGSRTRAVELFHTIYGGPLARRSQRYFDDITSALTVGAEGDGGHEILPVGGH